MAKRKTENSTELIEAIRQRLDLRRTQDKQIWGAVEGFASGNNTKRLSLIKGLLIARDSAHLERVDEANLVDYVKLGKDSHMACMCGTPLHKEVYHLKASGPVLSTGLEAHVAAVVSKGTPQRRQSTEFVLGDTCYNKVFPELLVAINAKDDHQKRKEAPLKNNKTLTKIALNLSAELTDKIVERGWDSSTLEEVANFLKHNSELLYGDESGTLFDMDTSNNRSFANWILDEVNSGRVKDEEVIDAAHKLERVAHLITPGDLALLAVYSYEFRKYPTEALIRGFRKDLQYMADGPSRKDWRSRKKTTHILEQEISRWEGVKERHSQPNIDKHYVRPKTRFRSRKNLPKKTIREVLDQTHMSFLEALGLRNHFSWLEEVRVGENRCVANQYGNGNYWYHLIKDITAAKSADNSLNKARKAAGQEIDKYEWSLTYTEKKRTLPPFLKRSEFWGRTARENYLRFFSIESWQEVAPKIVTIGRRLRMAKELKGELYNKAFDLQYVPIEDVDLEKEGVTGITLEDLAKLFNEASFVEHNPFQEFREKYSCVLATSYGHGIVPVDIVSPKGTKNEILLKRYYDIAVKKGVVKLTDEQQQQCADLRAYYSTQVIQPSSRFDVSRFVTFGLNGCLAKLASVYTAAQKAADKYSEAGLDIFEDGLAAKVESEAVALQQQSLITRSQSLAYLQLESLTVNKTLESSISYYDISKIRENQERVKDTIRIDLTLVEKLEFIQQNYKLLRRHADSYSINAFSSRVSSLSSKIKEGKQIFASQEFIDMVIADYGILMPRAAEAQEIESARLAIDGKINMPAMLSSSAGFRDSHKTLTDILIWYPGLEELLDLKFPGFGIARRVYTALNQWDAGKAFDNVDEVASFDSATTLDSVLDAQHFDISQKLRQNQYTRVGRGHRARTVKVFESKLKSAFKDEIYHTIVGDEAILHLARGVGAEENGGRKFYGNGNAHYHSPLHYNQRGSSQDKNNKFDFFRFAKLDDVASGEKAKYEIPVEMRERFEEDIKEGRIHTRTFDFDEYGNKVFGNLSVEQLQVAMSRFESLVNTKLLEEYTLRSAWDRRYELFI
jgi:hypothetical protein